jgi:AcrR family transcriptional regulator
MFTSNDGELQGASSGRKRGRPPGPTAKSAETRARLYEVAAGLIAEKGYEAATLREIAGRAGVSPGLLYRYFPSKAAVVLELYDEASEDLVARAAALPRGPWRERFVFALRASLETLTPHRPAMTALIPVLVGGREEGLFSPATAFSRERVQRVFADAVSGARDAPKPADAAALGRVLYLAHLGVILWWLLDRSEGQRATRRLITVLERALSPFALAYKLGPTKSLVRDLDDAFGRALYGSAA